MVVVMLHAVAPHNPTLESSWGAQCWQPGPGRGECVLCVRSRLHQNPACTVIAQGYAAVCCADDVRCFVCCSCCRLNEKGLFDYLLLNDDLTATAAELERIAEVCQTAAAALLPCSVCLCHTNSLLNLTLGLSAASAACWPACPPLTHPSPWVL